MQPEYDYLFTFKVVGDKSVGQFINNIEADNYRVTNEGDIRTKNLDINGTLVKLQIWDVSGQNAQSSQGLSEYHQKAEGYIIVFDVSEPTSFQNIKQWLFDIDRKTNAKAEIILVSVKSDATLKRLVSSKEAQSLADTLGLSYFDASENKEDSIELVLTALCQKVLQKTQFFKIFTSSRNHSNPNFFKLNDEHQIFRNLIRDFDKAHTSLDKATDQELKVLSQKVESFFEKKGSKLQLIQTDYAELETLIKEAKKRLKTNHKTTWLGKIGLTSNELYLVLKGYMTGLKNRMEQGNEQSQVNLNPLSQSR